MKIFVIAAAAAAVVVWEASDFDAVVAVAVDSSRELYQT